jgi:multidrug resistance efflux pump
VDVESIVSRLDEDLATAEAQLRAALGRVEEAQARVRELQQLRDGFVGTVERYGKAIVAGEAPPSSETEVAEDATGPHPWSALSQADAVLAALAEIGRPAATAEVYEKLAKAGRSEDTEKVRGTLGYLYRRAKKVDRMGRGLWELPGDQGLPTGELPMSRNGSGEVST